MLSLSDGSFLIFAFRLFAGQSTMQCSAQNKGNAIEKENIQSLSRLEVNYASIGEWSIRF